jgi:hypothetical protein
MNSETFVYWGFITLVFGSLFYCRYLIYNVSNLILTWIIPKVFKFFKIAALSSAAIAKSFLPKRVQERIDKRLLILTFALTVGTALIKARTSRVSKKISNKLTLILKPFKLRVNKLLNPNFSLEENLDGTIKLTYPIKDRVYCMLITPPPPSRKHPAPIIFAFDENNNEITDDILTYLGPTYTWHGVEYTPWLLGYGSVNIHLNNGEERSFKNFEVIKIS